MVAVDRHSGKETDEFQPQKRTKLYGVATAYAQCPSGKYSGKGGGGFHALPALTPSEMAYAAVDLGPFLAAHICDPSVFQGVGGGLRWNVTQKNIHPDR